MMHKHTYNKLVKRILRTIAKQEQFSFPSVKKLFISGEMHVTHSFWEILAQDKPNHSFIDVYYCPECGKFSLE